MWASEALLIIQGLSFPGIFVLSPDPEFSRAGSLCLPRASLLSKPFFFITTAQFPTQQYQITPWYSLLITTMAANTDDTLVNLERHRQRLEESVAKLRKSLEHWQTWEFEYEGFREELLRFKGEPTPQEMVDIGVDFGGDFVNEKGKGCLAVATLDAD